MKKIKEWFNKMFAKSKEAVEEIRDNERGDTNFISIVIILVIVMVVAAVFIGFKDQILGAASDTFNDFMDIFSGQKVK